jgi:hypothetical protein
VVCEVLLVQRLRLMAVTVLSILVLTIIGAASLSPAYAAPPATMTLHISPNPALPGQAVTFSGQVTPPATGADNIEVFVESGAACAAPDIRVVWLAVNLAPSITPSGVPTFTGTANSAGFYSITVPGGFAADTYAVVAQDTSYAAVEVSSACNFLTVAPPIPEYPIGLPILAILMLFGYGLVRRRTRIDTA